MINRTIYMLFRSRNISETGLQAIKTELLSVPQTLLYFDVCTDQSVHFIRALLEQNLADTCCYLHESTQLCTKESELLSQITLNHNTIQDFCCVDFGKTSYTRQRRHKRFLEKSDYLIVVYDKPLAEINNTIRYATQLHKPIIQIYQDRLQF